MIKEKLQKLGLSDKDSKVYLATLELGSASVQNISKKSGVNRATSYLCLEKLEKLGLVKQIKAGKKTLFVGEYPEKLLENLINEQSRLKQREVEIGGLLPELNAIFNFSVNKPRVKFFEGSEGVKQIYMDTLYNNKEILAFLSIKDFDKNLLKELYKEYVPQRIKRDIWAYVIAPAEPLSEEYKQRDKQELRETRLIDPKKFPLSIEIDIYNNKVSFISYSTKEMFGVIIESEQVYKTMKFIFQIVWEAVKEN